MLTMQMEQSIIKPIKGIRNLKPLPKEPKKMVKKIPKVVENKWNVKLNIVNNLMDIQTQQTNAKCRNNLCKMIVGEKSTNNKDFCSIICYNDYHDNLKKLKKTTDWRIGVSHKCFNQLEFKSQIESGLSDI